MSNMKNAFGKTPDDFKACVANTLATCKEEENVKKIKWTPIIAIALCVFMLGTAMAASNLLGLGDFFEQMYGQKNASHTASDAPVNTYTIGDFRIDINEIIADGEYLYINALASSTAGDALILSSSMEPYMPMSAMGATTDTRSFVDLALEQNKRLFTYTVSASTADGQCYTDMMGGFPYPESGAMSHITTGAFPTDAQTLDVVLEIFLKEFDLKAEPEILEESWHTMKIYPYIEDSRILETYPLTLTIDPYATATADLKNTRIESAGLTLDHIDFKKTAMTVYYELYLTLDDPEGWPQIEFADADGNYVTGGTTLSTGLNPDPANEKMAIMKGSLDFAELPENFSIGVYDWETNAFTETYAFSTK